MNAFQGEVNTNNIVVKLSLTKARDFFFELQKNIFFLNGQALNPPPLLVAGPLKKKFFCGSQKGPKNLFKKINDIKKYFR